MSTYSVTGSELLLGRKNRATSPGGIERRLASDDCFSLDAGTCAPGFAADLCDGIPIFRHGRCAVDVLLNLWSSSWRICGGRETFATPD